MPIRPNNLPMTDSYRTALKILAVGTREHPGEGSITAVRTYPRPYGFTLTRPSGSELQSDVPQITINDLLEDGYMVGEALDYPNRDRVVYRITDAGRQGWRLDAPPVDPAQVALLADALTLAPVKTSMEAA